MDITRLEKEEAKEKIDELISSLKKFKFNLDSIAEDQEDIKETRILLPRFREFLGVISIKENWAKSEVITLFNEVFSVGVRK